MDVRPLILLALACNIANAALSQDTPPLSSSGAEKVNQLSLRYAALVGEKSEQANKAIDKQTQKIVDRLQREERTIARHMRRVDSLAAHNFLISSENKYAAIRNDIKNKAGKLQRNTGLYLPYTDTSLNALKFLSNNPLTGKLPVSPRQFKDAVNKVRALEAQLREAENVKEFIRQRRDYLRQQLVKYNLGNDLKKYNATIFSYGAQLRAIQSDLYDENKIERRALALLRQHPGFQKFITQNGALSGLFNVPADYGTTGISGLQTINQIQGLLAQRIGNLGPNGLEAAKASLASAQSELSKLRNKFPSLGDARDLPEGFIPDPVKTQRFKKRLSFSVDMQSNKGNALLPLSSTLSLAAGYKLDSKFTVGIRVSYQTGYGQDVRHIHISGIGAGAGGFVDWKWKKGFFFSASAEANYNSAIKNIEVLKDYNAWQPSLLAGIGKSLSLKTKVFKSTRVAVLFDFLHAAKSIPSQLVVFRAGYSL